MLSFLKSPKRNEGAEADDKNRSLLDEFSALDPLRQDEAGERLAVLWHCFTEEFKSHEEFHRAARTRQDAYIAKFERVAARSDGVKYDEGGHLHYSVALMLHFLLIARDGARDRSSIDLSERVASLIDRARERQLEATRSYLADALSTSRFNSPAAASTEVIVDRPMEFLDGADDEDMIQQDSDRTLSGDGSRGPGTTVLYMRDGARWVKRRRISSTRR